MARCGGCDCHHCGKRSLQSAPCPLSRARSLSPRSASISALARSQAQRLRGFRALLQRQWWQSHRLATTACAIQPPFRNECRVVQTQSADATSRVTSHPKPKQRKCSASRHTPNQNNVSVQLETQQCQPTAKGQKVVLFYFRPYLCLVGIKRRKVGGGDIVAAAV